MDKISNVTLPPESTFSYIVVRGSLHASDCSIFGMSSIEKLAFYERYEKDHEFSNGGVSVRGHIVSVINSLSELGYRVVTSTGENETTWTLAREI